MGGLKIGPNVNRLAFEGEDFIYHGIYEIPGFNQSSIHINFGCTDCIHACVYKHTGTHVYPSKTELDYQSLLSVISINLFTFAI